MEKICLLYGWNVIVPAKMKTWKLMVGNTREKDNIYE